MTLCLGSCGIWPCDVTPCTRVGVRAPAWPASEDRSHLPVQAAGPGSHGCSPAPAPSDL